MPDINKLYKLFLKRDFDKLQKIDIYSILKSTPDNKLETFFNEKNVKFFIAGLIMHGFIIDTKGIVSLNNG